MQIVEALWRIKQPKTVILIAAMKSLTFQKRSKKMLLHQRANHAD